MKEAFKFDHVMSAVLWIGVCDYAVNCMADVSRVLLIRVVTTDLRSTLFILLIDGNKFIKSNNFLLKI